MPDSEPEVIECPTCGRPTYKRNLRRCEVHKHERFCPFCPGVIWIPAWNWNFCTAETAIDYLTEKIQEADAEIVQLKQTAIKAEKGQ
jgi:hypothetical protein